MTTQAGVISATLSRPESISAPPSPSFNRVDSPSQPRHRTPRVVKPKTNDGFPRIDDVYENNGINDNHTSENHVKMNNVHTVIQAAVVLKAGVNVHMPDILKINVSGRVFELSTRQVHRYPNSLLARPSEVIKFFEPDLGMFFFDRNRHCFEWIAQYYQGDGFMKFPDELPS